MRIGFDGTPLNGQRAGIGNYTSHLLTALLNHNSASDYLLYSNHPLGNLEPTLRKAVQVPGYFLPSRWLWMQFMLPRLIGHTQPDICHYTNASAPVWHTKPFVLTIHDASLFLHREYHPWTRLLAIRTLLPIVARQADAIITVSEHARTDLAHTLRIPAHKIHVIYEAAPPHFRPITNKQVLATLRQHYHLPEQFIFYLGTLEPRKNLTRLIHALHQLHQRGCPTKLVLAGPPGWHMNGFHQEIERLGLATAVHYLGYVPTDHLPGLYSLATVFAFPSLYEGFGLPPLEAMACGTPVLTSRGSAMAEVGGDAVYLVNPYDVAELAEGLHQLLTNTTLSQEYGHRGQQRSEQFSWERAARATTAVYQQVLQPAPIKQVMERS
jgi:glycosyltransferase involved in cell wall biosynthesis